ncbi:hypothetical protein MAA_00752 [Metarhizium robertsii ARSEF 23]|uniref:Uncharacterized protein n=1 Tax=Metarhizium robertsii (strain ARSEF 23 / ATCC MYA-3075) TaxID=655844 RepID=E9EN01_METRA|nr:uncharacterized protein MAA_00752 [Metarhizium robertsii ARSEF 23]EFZ03678.2 hypothetical protein MAA_00752 [Metarhizium robertsii ARSEF 23]
MAAAGTSNWRDLVGSLRLSHDELFDFHQSHFSADAVASFGSDFLNPTERQEVYESNAGEDWNGDVDDGLGYYEDGVKRTLTDEQIEIFRHSELRDLERQQEHDKLPKSIGTMTGRSQLTSMEHNSTANLATRSSKKKKKKARSEKQDNPKPDLRKRTWDVVDAGLDSLDYD